MEKQKMDELIAKYNEGLADPAEIKTIERMIEEGRVELTQLRELTAFDEEVMKSDVPLPSMRLNENFYSMLADEKKKAARNAGVSFRFNAWPALMPRLAFTLVLTVLGFAGGYWLRRPAVNPEVQQLTQEVLELKEMMMLSLLEKESASDRIRAVGLTSDLGRVSDKVTNALFETLNNDPNVNVRLAAIDALTAYTKQSEVRQGLILSIARQESPLVQVTLAELMASIQEKRSVSELKKIVENASTPKDVRNRIKKSIDVLI